MKLITLAILLASSMAFAQGEGGAPAASEPAKKMSKKEAKAECKKAGTSKKEMKKCVADHMSGN